MSRRKPDRKAYEKAGRRAETLACWYLRFKGYRILARRIKTKVGEIDIAAAKGNALVIVEVKQRRDIATAEDSLKPGAWKRIHKAAQLFHSRSPALHDMAVRFDVVFIIGTWKIVHRPDIWRPN